PRAVPPPRSPASATRRTTPASLSCPATPSSSTPPPSTTCRSAKERLPMTSDITRRRLLQATGATIAAGYVTTQAGTATATPAPEVPPLVTNPIPYGNTEG